MKAPEILAFSGIELCFCAATNESRTARSTGITAWKKAAACSQAASRSGNVALIAAAAGDVDGELMIETDHENYGASHVYPDASARSDAIKVPAMRLLRILQDQDVGQVDSLKIDVEGYEDRVLIGFFRDAPAALWPRAIAIEHLSRDDWVDDCLADMLGRGYAETGKTRSNTLLVRGSN